MSSAVPEPRPHHEHRATRSVRCTLAAGLVAAMAALTIVPWIVGVSAGLVLVANLILGCVAAALLNSVIHETRQASARGRADLAARMATQARMRSQEHLRFATSLGRQLRAVRAENAQLGARARELEARLSEAETELVHVRDALWISEAAEKRARAALVVAEQTVQGVVQPAGQLAGQPGRHLRPA